MKRYTCSMALALMLAAPFTLATTHATEAHAAEQKTAPANAMADGEVRRIDKDAKKITIRHGPIQSLDMPAMTMVFQVKDAAMLDKVNPGDKIKFSAEKIGGTIIVTDIESAK